MRSIRIASRTEIFRASLFVLLGVGFLFVSSHFRHRQREKRALAGCQNRLHTIGMAMLMYTQDYDETLPRPQFGPQSGPLSYRWMESLSAYTTNWDNFNCPAATESYTPGDSTRYGNYVLNNAYFASGDKQTPPAGASMSKIVSPTSVVLVADGQGDFQFAWPNAKVHPSVTLDRPRRLNHIWERHWHGGGYRANFLFCDGHIKAMPLEQIAQMEVIDGQKVMTSLTIEDD